ncbi:MAG: IgGFc-binding protein [Deltaproteobacteria bacterium]|nr:IgGFc-binding protein [Deltaproteobacteria bacterium]
MYFAILAAACGPEKKSGGPGDSNTPPSTTTESCTPPGSTRCNAAGAPEKCSDDGIWTADAPCASGWVCDPDKKACAQRICVPDEPRACVNGNQLETCNAAGTEYVLSTCPGGQVCDGIRCKIGVCTPGQTICKDDVQVQVCNSAGAAWEDSSRCGAGFKCVDGDCVAFCTLAAREKTNIGCEYWAVDLDNAYLPGQGDAQGAQYAVVVANTHPVFDARVTIKKPGNVLVDSAVVQAGGLHAFRLPRMDVNGTEIAQKAYLVESSIPIVAYQFNPLQNEDVFSNDASLLLPNSALGLKYMAVTRAQPGNVSEFRGFVAIVGTEDNTTVTVKVTAKTMGGEGIAALDPGGTVQKVINRFDVFNIESNAEGADLTGTEVSSDKPVAVFSGAEASYAPSPPPLVCCGDHLEKQMYPEASWGTRYLATKSALRGRMDDQGNIIVPSRAGDLWRVLAKDDGTEVRTAPFQAAIPVLNRGQWFEFESFGDFEVVATKPVLVTQFLTAQDAPGTGRLEDGDNWIGDPTMITAVPVEQFRKNYIFLAPDSYKFDFVNVVAPVGAVITLDGQPLSVALVPFGTGRYAAARIPIADGTHRIDSDKPVGVIVYGWDRYVSYGYPGGLSLEDLTGQVQ